MRFVDPLGLLEFNLPLGWGYDAWDSRLDLIGFRWWEDRQHLLGVNLSGNPVPSDASDETWFDHVRRTDGSNTLKLSVCQRLANRCVATGEHFESTSGVYRRQAVVRGPGLNVFFDHAEILSKDSQFQHGIQILSPTLQLALRSLVFPMERQYDEQPPDEKLATVALQTALAAAKQNDWTTVGEKAAIVLTQARRKVATDFRANSLPNAGAVLMIINALIMSGDAGIKKSQLSALAERVGRRARASAAATGWPRGNDTAQLKLELDRLIALAALQEIEVLNTGAPSLSAELVNGPDQSFLLRRSSRAQWAQAQACKWSERGEVDAQEAALEEALSELATIVIAPYPLRDPGLLGFAEQKGVTKLDDLLKLACISTRRRTLAEMTHVLAQLEDLGFRGANAARNHDITRFALAMARELVQPPVLEIDSGLCLAFGSESGRVDALLRALTRRAYALLSVGDTASFEHAQALVDEGEQLLKQGDGQVGEDAIAPEANIDRASLSKSLRAVTPSTRIEFCTVAAKVAMAREDKEKAQALVERGLELWSQADPAERSVRSREELEHLGCILSGRMPPLFEEQLSSTETNTPYHRLRRAFNSRNAAVTHFKHGQLDECLRKVQAGLADALAVSPFNEYVPSLLHLAAAALTQSTDDLGRATWYLALAGALDCLDARRILSIDGHVQVGLGEAKLTNDIQDEFLDRLIDLNMAEQALEIADRARGRSLALALHRASQPPLNWQPLVGTAPDISGSDPLAGILNAVAYIQEQFKPIVETTPAAAAISAEQARNLSAETKAAFLVIQPVRNRVGLITICPSGELSACWSPVPLPALRDALSELLSRHNVFQAARGEEREPVSAHPPNASTEPMADSVQVLWQALIEPVRERLKPGQPLVLFPFRDFSLLPFSVLQDAAGNLLADLHPLSLAPSLASLRSLRARGAWPRPMPQRAYLLGNPALAEREAAIFDTLPGAEAEATFVCEALLSRGVPESDVKLRIGPQGSESSYRNEAANCDLVHLACHGLMEDPAVQSYLALAPSPPHDGCLMVTEVPEVPLADALVFLSACQTGQGRPTADGVIGLGRAFLEAGARAVVMSLWKVSDAASAQLARHFYRVLLSPAPSRTASEALQEAMRLTREDLKAGNISNAAGKALADRPAYWAPFVVVGDAEAIRFEAPPGCEAKRDEPISP